MQNTIKCTYCGQQIEVSKAFRHEIEENLKKSFEESHKKEIEEATKNAEKKAKKDFEEKSAIELKDLRIQLEEKEKRVSEFRERELELRAAQRKIEEEKKDLALELEKKLDEERKKIQEKVQKEAEEAQHTKLLEKEKQIKDAEKQIEELKRRLQQGSQQMQGEVFEEEFENLLTQRYPNDQISPVGKGIRGADIIQEVWDRNGNRVGQILWELKNTKNWTEGWIDKLRADQRELNAEEAVLITTALPSDMKTAGFRRNIWVTKRDHVELLADTLRAKLIQLQYAKNAAKGKNEKMEILYEYLTGTEFKYRVEAIIESFTNMQNEIEKEKRYFSNKWARDEKNIRQVIDNTVGMHGDLKGIVGASIPQLKGLDMPELEDGQR